MTKLTKLIEEREEKEYFIKYGYVNKGSVYGSSNSIIVKAKSGEDAISKVCENYYSVFEVHEIKLLGSIDKCQTSIALIEGIIEMVTKSGKSRVTSFYYQPPRFPFVFFDVCFHFVFMVSSQN